MATSSLLVAQPPNASTTDFARSILAVTLAVANTGRRGLCILNDISQGILLIKLGTGASVTDHGFRLLPYNTLYLPFPVYTGIITGVWLTAGTGQARVTEMTI